MADQDFKINVVTTADTSGIRQTESALSDLQRRAAQIGPGAALAERDALRRAAATAAGGEEAGGAFGGKFVHGFERVAIHAAGIGLVYGAIEAIKKVAEEVNKITDALDKQGAALVKNSREMILQSGYAKDDADILKIAELGMKNIAELHKTVEETQKRELSLWEKIADATVKGQTFGQAAPAEAIVEEERQQAARNELAARRTTIAAIEAAYREKERRDTQGYAGDVEELTGKLRQQEALREKARTAGDVQGFYEAARAAAQYAKELEVVTQALEKETAAAVKATQDTIDKSDESIKRVLINEQAARTARGQGHERDAALFQKTADQYEKSLLPQQKEQLAEIRRQQGQLEPPPPPKPQRQIPPGYDLNTNTGELIPQGQPGGARTSPGTVTDATGIKEALNTLSSKFDQYWG